MFNHKNIKTQLALPAIMLLLGLTSCEKLVETSPVGAISTDKAYDNEKNIEASVNGIYYTMQQTGSLYNGIFATTYSLLADEAKVGSGTSTNNLQFSGNEIAVANTTVSALWNNAYAVIYQCNTLIENVAPKQGLIEDKKNQFLGEAKFLRAYSYFMLVQYYGAVPLTTSSDYRINNALSRTPVNTVNDFITKELEEAALLLPDGFSIYGGARTRVTKQAAQALSARQYLYLKNWEKAQEKATLLIENNTFNLPANFDDVVKSNSTESIFEMWFSSAFATSNYSASGLVPNTTFPNPAMPQVLPSDKLVNAFETNPVTGLPDKRKSAFIRIQATPAPGYSYQFKYRDFLTGTDQPKFFRLAEQYLIRAEARAQLNLATANDDINAIRSRAGLENTTAVTKDQQLDAIAQERFVELCFEGDRWRDLVRTGKADAILGAYKPVTWQPTDKLLPVPASELGRNPNLNPQNPGYTK